MDRPEHGLVAGDVGAVVHVLKNGKGYVVEFTTFRGDTVAVVTVSPDQIRPIHPNEVYHARRLESAAR